MYNNCDLLQSPVHLSKRCFYSIISVTSPTEPPVISYLKYNIEIACVLEPNRDNMCTRTQ